LYAKAVNLAIYQKKNEKQRKLQEIQFASEQIKHQLSRKIDEMG
jgi:hypothetical protein